MKKKELTRQKVAAILRKANIPKSETTRSQQVRGWSSSSTGYRVRGGKSRCCGKEYEDPIQISIHDAASRDNGHVLIKKIAKQVEEALTAAGISWFLKDSAWITYQINGWSEE